MPHRKSVLLALLDLARLGGGHSWMGRSAGTNIVLWVFLPHGDDGDFSFSEGVFFCSLYEKYIRTRGRDDVLECKRTMPY